MSSRTRFSSAVTDIQSLLGDADPAAADLDDATGAWLAHTRQAITAQRRVPGRRWAWAAVPHRAPGPRRRLLAAAGALAAAAALAGVLLATPFASSGPTAAQFLDNAAATLLRQSAPPPPRPDQFVYTENKTANGHLYQAWLSANGKRAGWANGARLPGCAKLVCRLESAGYLPNLPTQPGPLRRYLTRIRLIPTGPPPAGTPNWAANYIGKAVDQLMATRYLLPAQRAALFRLLAHTPGFTIVPGVRDAIGRPGVAIRWTYEGGTAEIIVNPATYAYLGDRTIPPGGYAGEIPKGQKGYDGYALIKLAIVGHAGQQP